MKEFLINVSKQAVNAVLVNSGLMLGWSGIFNLHDWAGVKSLLIATGITIASREAAVYLPQLLAWSTSTTEQRAATAAKKEAIAEIKAAPTVPDLPKKSNSYADLGR